MADDPERRHREADGARAPGRTGDGDRQEPAAERAASRLETGGRGRALVAAGALHPRGNLESPVLSHRRYLKTLESLHHAGKIKQGKSSAEESVHGQRALWRLCSLQTSWMRVL